MQRHTCAVWGGDLWHVKFGNVALCMHKQQGGKKVPAPKEVGGAYLGRTRGPEDVLEGHSEHRDVVFGVRDHL